MRSSRCVTLLGTNGRFCGQDLSASPRGSVPARPDRAAISGALRISVSPRSIPDRQIPNGIIPGRKFVVHWVCAWSMRLHRASADAIGGARERNFCYRHQIRISINNATRALGIAEMTLSIALALLGTIAGFAAVLVLVVRYSGSERPAVAGARSSRQCSSERARAHRAAAQDEMRHPQTRRGLNCCASCWRRHVADNPNGGLSGGTAVQLPSSALPRWRWVVSRC